MEMSLQLSWPIYCNLLELCSPVMMAAFSIRTTKQFLWFTWTRIMKYVSFFLIALYNSYNNN